MGYYLDARLDIRHLTYEKSIKFFEEKHGMNPLPLKAGESFEKKILPVQLPVFDISPQALAGIFSYPKTAGYKLHKVFGYSF